MTDAENIEPRDVACYWNEVSADGETWPTICRREGAWRLVTREACNEDCPHYKFHDRRRMKCPPWRPGD
jgi:hypothetical protein